MVKIEVCIIALILILFVAGCTQQPTGQDIVNQTLTKYVCPDGSTVDKPELCTGQKTQTQSQQPSCTSNWSCGDWNACVGGTHTRTCTDSNNCGVTSGKPAEIEKCTVSFETIKSNALNVSYGELMRNVENYQGKIVYYRGEVIQIAQNYGDNYVLRVSVTRDKYGLWSDAVWVNYNGPRVLENDIIEFWGKVKGLKTYEAVLGNSVTVPEIDAIYLDVVFKSELRAECGKTGKICCENTDCDYGNICVNNICQVCGEDNQLPCTSGCSYGYELLNGNCVKECSYSQIRINGVCTDCGGLNEPCCSDSKCDYSKVCQNNVCVNCGLGAGQPCCSGEYKCLLTTILTCINNVCEYCGMEGKQCCDNNVCGLGTICNNNICEHCGFTGEKCCSSDNPWICITGSCSNGICIS